MQGIEELNKYYSFTLRHAAEDRSTQENNNLYLLGFFGLMRNGFPYEINEEVIEQEIPEPVKGKKKQKTKEQEVPEEPKEVIRTVSILLHKKGYTCNEEELITMFGDQYHEVVARKNQHIEEVAEHKEDREFILPNVNFGEEVQPAEKKEEIPEQTAQVPKKKLPVIPYIKDDEKYPDDVEGRKEYDSFLFNTHEVLVRFDDGIVKPVTVTVYPLTMDTSDRIASDVFVIAEDDESRLRTGFSGAGNQSGRSVVVDFGEYALIVRGNWRNGDFNSSVSIYSVADQDRKAYIDANMKRTVPTKRTSRFFMRYRAKNGNYLNLFPTTLLRNDPGTGLAQTVAMIETETEKKIYTAEAGTHLSLWFDNAQKDVVVYWAGNSLNLQLIDEDD